MKIDINGQNFDVPEAFVHQLADVLWGMFEKMYEEKVDDAAKFGLMAVTRAMLVKEELMVRMMHGKEAARAMRPPPKADPNLWIARQYLPYLREVINGATLSLSCETGDNTITALDFTITSVGGTGGQVDIAGQLRLRENDCA